MCITYTPSCLFFWPCPASSSTKRKLGRIAIHMGLKAPQPTQHMGYKSSQIVLVIFSFSVFNQNSCYIVTGASTFNSAPSLKSPQCGHIPRLKLPVYSVFLFFFFFLSLVNIKSLSHVIISNKNMLQPGYFFTLLCSLHLISTVVF